VFVTIAGEFLEALRADNGHSGISLTPSTHRRLYKERSELQEPVTLAVSHPSLGFDPFT